MLLFFCKWRKKSIDETYILYIVVSFQSFDIFVFFLLFTFFVAMNIGQSSAILQETLDSFAETHLQIHCSLFHFCMSWNEITSYFVHHRSQFELWMCSLHVCMRVYVEKKEAFAVWSTRVASFVSLQIDVAFMFCRRFYIAMHKNSFDSKFILKLRKSLFIVNVVICMQDIFN